ncbi:MAG: hypothetical protein QXN59_00825 [Candidatus Micrarchaeaceae archaeon]
MSKLEFADTLLLRLSIGMPFGIAAFSFLELAAYYIFGKVTYATLIIPTILLGIAALALEFDHISNKFKIKRLRQYFLGKKLGLTPMLALYLIVLYAIIGTIFFVSVFQSNGTLYCEGPGCSDTMFHIGIGNSLLYSTWPPKLYYAYGAKNVFPFMYDFFVSIMVKYGMGVWGGLAVPEQIMVFSFICLSVIIAYKITKSELKTLLSTVILWFGGTGFIQLIDYPFRNTLSKLLYPIHLLVPPVAHGVFSGINAAVYVSTDFITYWVSVVNTMLIAQRDFMLGLPLGFAALYMIYAFAFEKKAMSKKDAAFLGIVIGMLPLVHPLTLVMVVVVAAFSVVVYVATSKKKIASLANTAIAACFALAIGIPQMLYIDSQPKGLNWFYANYGGFIIHMHNPILTVFSTVGNVLFFWIEVVGLPVVIGIIGLIYARRNERLFFIPFLALWVLITLISITPNPADENEIFLYIFFMLGILSSELLYRLWRSNKAGKALAVVFMVIICFNSLFVVYFDDLHNVQLLETPAQLAAANFISNNTPRNAVFAVSDYNTFNPIVSTLGARQTLISIAMYVGGIVTVSPQQLENANSEIFSKGSCAAINQYNVSYVYLQSNNLSSEMPFQNSNFSVVYKAYDTRLNNNITIYRTNCRVVKK